jgi:hypothetical protein
MKDCQCYAKCVDPERQKLWDKVFCNGRAPITCPIPVGRANLAGQEAEFYLIDFDRVSHAEKELLISAMAEKFNLAPVEVRQDIEKQGAPIKADSVIVSWCRKHSIAAM